MTRYIILPMLVVLAVAVAVVFSGRYSFAAEPACPAGLSIGEIVAMVEKDGGELVDIIDVRTDHLDQIVVAVKGHVLVVGGAKGGCVVTQPMPVDSVAVRVPA